MKNNIKYLGLFAIVLFFFSCSEESNFKEPDIDLVPVYAITNIVGTNAPYAINIYREKPIIIVYTTSVNPISYTATGYTDNSTESSYDITVNRVSENETIKYTITADKATGVGNLTVVGASTTAYTIKVTEKEVYN